MELKTKIEETVGIGPKYTKKLKKLKIETVLDLLFYFPRKYNDFSKIIPIKDIENEKEATIRGLLLNIRHQRTKSGRFLTLALVSDKTGIVQLIWFNQPYIKNLLKKGDEIIASGKIEREFSKFSIVSPVFEKIATSDLFFQKRKDKKDLTHVGRIVPMYSQTEGLTSKWLRAKIKNFLPLVKKIKDFLPPRIIKKFSLMPLKEALLQIHFPENHQKLKAAQKRLGFNELFLIQLNYLKRKFDFQKEKAHSMPFAKDAIKKFVNFLPFKLTEDQKKAILEILQDLKKTYPSNRLLEGDVGCGKTIVACVAILNAVEAGFQSAFMCPTEVLSYQHYLKIKEFFKNFSFSIALLLGSLSQKEKEKIKEELKEGKIDLVVGTHSLIQEDVKFKKLGLAIIDEQHRFGVEQRAKLKEANLANFYPHFLSMSATPIPRTLALALYGDLDFSLIQQMPPGRKIVITRLIKPEKRKETYNFVKEHLKKGRQIYVICPLIEESDKLGVKAATTEYQKLKEGPFSEFNVGMLHGKMKSKEKEKIMKDFSEGKIDILVSTPVVEVGVDIKNATIMIIEGAERFGLASLHQFRGRVGRGEEQSYCFLFCENPTNQSIKRLSALLKSQDGFELAEKDLLLRGPGEIYGLRQHGIPDLKMASLQDLELIKLTKEAARIIIEEDSTLLKYPLLRNELEKFSVSRHLE